MKLFDALDEICFNTQDEAKDQGLSEGDDDEESGKEEDKAE